jgi:hypothetical protein
MSARVTITILELAPAKFQRFCYPLGEYKKKEAYLTNLFFFCPSWQDSSALGMIF